MPILELVNHVSLSSQWSRRSTVAAVQRFLLFTLLNLATSHQPVERSLFDAELVTFVACCVEVRVLTYLLQRAIASLCLAVPDARAAGYSGALRPM